MGKAAAREKMGLARELSLTGATSMVVGTIIGTGIFIVPSRIATEVETAGLLFAVWIMTGMLALLGALAYAELGGAMPRAGGEYVYLRQAYGPMFGFLYGWTYFWVAKTGSIAALATGFALYLGHFVDLSQVFYSHDFKIFGLKYELTLGIRQVVAIALIILLSEANYFGVKTGGLIQSFFTGLKVGIILLLFALGFASGGSWGHFLPLLPEDPNAVSLGSFGVAMVAALWAYDGWNNLNMVAGEVKDPGKNVPGALMAGTIAVIAIYLLANLVYVYVLPLERIKASERVAADVAQVALGDVGASLFATAVLLSIFAALNGAILSGARIFYAMAEDGLFFRAVARVHPRYRTPTVSLALQAAWASLLTLTGTFDQLITYVIFAEWLFYGLTAASLLVLRRRSADMLRPYKMHGYPVTPAIFVAMAFSLTVNTLVADPRDSVIGLALIALGLPAYFYWKRQAA